MGHVNVQGFCVPVVYFLLPGKSKPLYQKLLRIMQDMVPSVDTKTWLFDFEASMLYAHKESMEHVSSGGCLFHFTKVIQRKVGGKGFRQKYSDDTDFRRRVMALSTLACLPLPHVECAFDSLKMEFLVGELPSVEYFEHTYIGTDRVNSRHPNAFRSRPIFAPAFWNVLG